MAKDIKLITKGDFIICKTFMNNGVKTGIIDSFHDKTVNINNVLSNKEMDNSTQSYEFFEVDIIVETKENEYRVTGTRAE